MNVKLRALMLSEIGCYCLSSKCVVSSMMKGSEMAKRVKASVGAIGSEKVGVLLGKMLDEELCVREALFESRRTLRRIEGVSDPSHDRKPGVLVFGGVPVDVVGQFDGLGDVAGGAESFIFFYNLHDNIVKELVLLEMYSREMLAERLRLVVSRRAREGGVNLFGVVAGTGEWVFALREEPGFEVLLEFYSGAGGPNRYSTHTS